MSASSKMLLIVFMFLVTMTMSRETAQLEVKNIHECPTLSPRSGAPPADVYDLRPDDIEVVMSVGDSITAGFGAHFISIRIPKISDFFFRNGIRNFPLLTTGGIFEEYRGASFFAGMDENATTVANFLAKYSSKLVGGSREQHLLTFCVGKDFAPASEYVYRPEYDQLNAAISGAECGNADQEINYLVEQTGAIKGFSEKWKMMSFYLGQNDMCRRAKTVEGVDSFIEYYEHEIRRALLRIKQEFPKTVVVLMLPIEASGLRSFMGRTLACAHAFPLTMALCPCAMIYGEEGRKAMKKAHDMMVVSLKRIAEEINAQVRKEVAEGGIADFGIITMPLLSGLDISEPDFPREFAATLDCFHPSLACHQEAAKLLW